MQAILVILGVVAGVLVLGVVAAGIEALATFANDDPGDD